MVGFRLSPPFLRVSWLGGREVRLKGGLLRSRARACGSVGVGAIEPRGPWAAGGFSLPSRVSRADARSAQCECSRCMRAGRHVRCVRAVRVRVPVRVWLCIRVRACVCVCGARGGATPPGIKGPSCPIEDTPGGS